MNIEDVDLDKIYYLKSSSKDIVVLIPTKVEEGEVLWTHGYINFLESKNFRINIWRYTDGYHILGSDKFEDLGEISQDIKRQCIIDFFTTPIMKF